MYLQLSYSDRALLSGERERTLKKKGYDDYDNLVSGSNNRVPLSLVGQTQFSLLPGVTPSLFAVVLSYLAHIPGDPLPRAIEIDEKCRVIVSWLWLYDGKDWDEICEGDTMVRIDTRGRGGENIVTFFVKGFF